MHCVVLVAVLLAGSPPRAATSGVETPVEGDRPYWRTNLFKRVFTDQKFLVTRWWPQEFKGNPVFLSSLGLGVALAAQSGSPEGGGWDRDLAETIADASGTGTKNLSHGFTKIGNGVPTAALLGVTYLWSRHAHNDRLAETSSLATESLIDAGIWIEVLKRATARVRPGGTNAGSFFQYGAQNNSSFPSGHSMGAFSVATVFAQSYRDHRWVPWVSYGMASLIATSRLTLSRHFPGDALVGAVLGNSIGRGVVGRSREEGSSPPRIKGSFEPVVGPGGRGLGVGWSYTWQ